MECSGSWKGAWLGSLGREDCEDLVWTEGLLGGRWRVVVGVICVSVRVVRSTLEIKVEVLSVWKTCSVLFTVLVRVEFCCGSKVWDALKAPSSKYLHFLTGLNGCGG